MTSPSKPPDAGDPIRREALHEGQVWRVILNRPKGNVLDARMLDELCDVFRRAATEKHLKLVSIEGAGEHFSFGASVEEHLPAACAGMLAKMREMLSLLNASSVACHALIRGQCLGGGLELAAFCQRVIAHPDAQLGQPEIRLGVFAPFASVILSDRVGRGHAEDLCISGRSVSAEEALRMGLVDELHADPWQASESYFQRHMRDLSASSLRFAVKAARLESWTRFRGAIDAIESLYLEELMSSHDANEGLRAFLDKRKPNWKDE